MALYGGGSLPAPLSVEEERQLISALEAGDRSVKRQLVKRNLRLVVYVANKFDNTGISLEDLTSIGSIGLIKAVNTFDPSKKIKLATYSSRCIENEILMYLRSNGKLRAEISFDVPLNVDWDGNELLLSDVLGTDPDVTEKRYMSQATRNIIAEIMSKLPSREKGILEMRYGFNGDRVKTQKETAAAFGISQSYISRLEKKLIKKVGNQYKKQINAEPNRSNRHINNR